MEKSPRDIASVAVVLIVAFLAFPFLAQLARKSVDVPHPERAAMTPSMTLPAPPVTPVAPPAPRPSSGVIENAWRSNASGL